MPGMAKRARTWEPDIYDMAAARAARQAAVMPPAPAVTDLAVAMEATDATDAPLEPQPALDEAAVMVGAAPRPRAARSDNSTLIGLVAGALAGAALGLLAAPASGEALRRQLRTTAESRTHEVARQVETVAQNVPHPLAARADPSTAEERNRA
jgi:hypothetical protein